MTKELDKLLDTIGEQAVQECGYCGKKLPDDGKSRFHCDEVCQGRWHRRDIGMTVSELPFAPDLPDIFYQALVDHLRERDDFVVGDEDLTGGTVTFRIRSG